MWGIYISRSAPIEVIPPLHKNCMEEALVLFNRTEVFMDPISYVLKVAG